MNATEKESLLQEIRTLVDESPTGVTKKSLADTERMIETLPDDVPAPNSVETRVERGVVLNWKLPGDHHCYLSMDAESRMRGNVSYEPMHTMLAKFTGQNASDTVEVPAEFMAVFREVASLSTEKSKLVGDKRPWEVSDPEPGSAFHDVTIKGRRIGGVKRTPSGFWAVHAKKGGRQPVLHATRDEAAHSLWDIHQRGGIRLEEQPPTRDAGGIGR